MKYLDLVSARQVNGDDGLEFLAGQAGGEGHGVLFGDRHVEIAVGKALGELHQPRPFAHRRGDADDGGITLGRVAQPLAEDLRIRGSGARFLEDFAAGRIERTRAMPLDRVRFGRCIALALACDDVQKLRPPKLFDILESGDQRLDVVTVHRPDVVEAHLFEQGAGKHHALQVLFGAAREFPHRGHLSQHLLAAFAQVGIHAAGQGACQVIGQRADILRNRHVVVVEVISRSAGAVPA